jgi:hypothetical protein
MKKGPFKMEGSPHKLGTIEGTVAHKASMAKAKAFTVEQTRTSGDKTVIEAASELGSSYIPTAIDYNIESGFTVDSKGKKKKKNGKKNGKKKGALEEEIIDTSDLTKKERLQLGESLYPEEKSKTKKKEREGSPSWDEILRETGNLPKYTK